MPRLVAVDYDPFQSTPSAVKLTPVDPPRFENEGAPRTVALTPVDFDPFSQPSPIVPAANQATPPPSHEADVRDPAVARAEALLPPQFRGLPEASAVEPSWLDRIVAGFKRHENLSQNVSDLIGDRIPRVDPATGQVLSLDERRQERLAAEARAAEALPADAPVTLGDKGLELLGAIGKEASDPIALLAGGYGAAARGLARLGKLAAAGGIYEGAAATAEQVSDAGEITAPGEIAARSAIGAVAAPALDVAIRGIGTGIKKLLTLRNSPDADTAVIDDQIRAGTQALEEEATLQGADPTQAKQRLLEIVLAPDGEIAVPSRDPFALPAPEGRGMLEEAPADRSTPLTPAVDHADKQGERRARMNRFAEEYERLARATTDPAVRTELLQKAAFSRAEAAGTPTKASPAQRMDRLRRVDPETDTLDVAIRKLGGIDTELETDWSGRLLDVPKMFGLPALERPGKGKSLDALAERLFELGYIRSFDQGELANLLQRVEAGEQVHSRNVGDRRLENDLVRGRASDRDYTIETDGIDVAATGRDWVIDSDAGAIVPSRPINLDDLRRLEEEETNARQFFERESEGASAGPVEQPGGLRGDERGRVSQRLADPIARRPGDQSGTRDAAARETFDVDYTQRTDERAPTDVQQPTSAGPGAPDDRRGAAPVSGQLDLFIREADDAAEPVAALEGSGPRVKYTTTSTLPSGLRRVASAADVAHATAALRKEPQESLLAVVTDDDGNILRVVRHTVGTRDASQVDTGLLAAAAHSTPGGKQAWFVHQHPSGVPTQSDADRRFLSAVDDLLRDTGIVNRGSVVVAPGGHFTHEHPDPFFADSAHKDAQKIPAAPRRATLPVSERRFQRAQPPSDASISTPAEMRTALDTHSEGREGLLLLDTRHRPVGFLPMSADDMTRLRQGNSSPAARLLRALDESNASATAAIVESPNAGVLSQVHGNLKGFAAKASRNHLDTFNADGSSATERGIDYTPSTFYSNPFNEALKYGANTLRNNTAQAVPGALAGGMTGGAVSEGEPGTPRWWIDVGFGALVGAGASIGVFSGLRRAGVTGKGGLADRGVERAGDALGKWLGRGPADLEALKRQRQVMREFLDRQTGEIGVFLRDKFAPTERAQMADLIENRGIVPDLNRVHTQARALDEYLTFVTQRMKEYGLLPPGVEEGGYLHRYYAKNLGLDKSFREAKRQSLSGSYTIARGMVDTFDRSYMSPGVQPLTERVNAIQDEIAKLGRKRGDALDGDTAERMQDLQDELAELRKSNIREFVGEQNGKLKSFFFTEDEAARIGAAGEPVMARLFKDQAPAPRGTVYVEGVKELLPTDRLWNVKAVSRDGVKLKRDWTPAERNAWGEIRDAGYRFTRGMAEASHDLSLGKFFKDVSERRDWVSDEPAGDWVHVPTGKAQAGAGLERYGALAGKYVRPDIWRAVKNHGVAPRVLGAVGDKAIPLTNLRVIDVYRGALNRWKIWHTVYNPVSHFNNTYSNVEMLHMGGYSGVDLARGIRELGRGEQSERWREARDAGLLDGDWGTSVLQGEGGPMRALEDLAEAMRLQRDDTDLSPVLDTMMRVKEWWINSRNAVGQAEGAFRTGAEVARAVGQPAIKGLKFLKKPIDLAARGMERAYRFEDNVFKMAVFAAERNKGSTIEQARQAAEELFFDYRDLPDSVKAIRDFPVGLPFVSYTYKAAPAIARNIARNPERVLGLIMAYEAANYAVLVNEGMDPDQYLEVMDAYENTLPPWDSGRSLWGGRNFVILPGADNLLALGRSHAMGNPFLAEAGNSTLPGGVVTQALGARDILGSNPLRALIDAGMNEDWKGQKIYEPGASEDAKARAITAYLYQAWAPSNVLTPFGYHQSKVMEGLANEATQNPDGIAAPIVGLANEAAEALGFPQATGLDRGGKPVELGQTVLGTFGPKVRDIDTRKSVEIEQSQIDREISDKNRAINAEAKLRSQGRRTQAQFDEERAAILEEITPLKTQRSELGKSKQTLDDAELLEKQQPPPKDDQASIVRDALDIQRQITQQQTELLREQLAQQATAQESLLAALKDGMGRAPRRAAQRDMDIEIPERDPDGRAKRFRVSSSDRPDMDIEIPERDADGRAKRFRIRAAAAA